jgi:hypothetical protein
MIYLFEKKKSIILIKFQKCVQFQTPTFKIPKTNQTRIMKPKLNYRKNYSKCFSQIIDFYRIIVWKIKHKPNQMIIILFIQD